MKRNLNNLSKLAVAMGAMALAGGAFADATVGVSGGVDPVLSIAVKGTPTALGSIASAGGADVAIATLTEINNYDAGYTVSVSSANALAATDKTKFVLLRTGGSLGTARDVIGYTIKYGSDTVSSLVAGASTFTERTSVVNTPSGTDVALSAATIASSDAKPTGTYTDTLTFTIAHK